MPKAKTLDQRLKEELAPTAPSMIPEAIAPPKKEEEVVPDIKDLIKNPKDRLLAIRLVNDSLTWQAQESEAKKARKPITNTLKAIFGKYGIGKAQSGGAPINYFITPGRFDLKKAKMKLLDMGWSTDEVTAFVEECMGKESYTLRIGAAREEEE